jgi:hypothetical protein
VVGLRTNFATFDSRPEEFSLVAMNEAGAADADVLS